MTKEYQIEENLIEQLKELKYIHRPDIVDRNSLEQNFKAKFEALNRVRLSENEFLRLREEIENSNSSIHYQSMFMSCLWFESF